MDLRSLIDAVPPATDPTGVSAGAGDALRRVIEAVPAAQTTTQSLNAQGYDVPADWQKRWDEQDQNDARYTQAYNLAHSMGYDPYGAVDANRANPVFEKFYGEAQKQGINFTDFEAAQDPRQAAMDFYNRIISDPNYRPLTTGEQNVRNSDAQLQQAQAAQEQAAQGVIDEQQNAGWHDFENFGPNVAAQFGKTVTGIKAGLDAAGQYLHEKAPWLMPGQAYQRYYQQAPRSNEAARQQYNQQLAAHPLRTGLAQVAAGLVTGLPQMAAAVAAPEAAPFVWGATGYGNQYERARDAGASDQQAQAAGNIGALTGAATAYIPGGQGAEGFLRSGGAMAAQSAADDLAAKGIYGDNKSTGDIAGDALQSGLIGAVLHGILHAPAAMAHLSDRALVGELGMEPTPENIAMVGDVRDAAAAGMKSGVPIEQLDQHVARVISQRPGLIGAPQQVTATETFPGYSAADYTKPQRPTGLLSPFGVTHEQEQHVHADRGDEQGSAAAPQPAGDAAGPENARRQFPAAGQQAAADAGFGGHAQQPADSGNDEAPAQGGLPATAQPAGGAVAPDLSAIDPWAVKQATKQMQAAIDAGNPGGWKLNTPSLAIRRLGDKAGPLLDYLLTQAGHEPIPRAAPPVESSPVTGTTTPPTRDVQTSAPPFPPETTPEEPPTPRSKPKPTAPKNPAGPYTQEDLENRIQQAFDASPERAALEEQRTADQADNDLHSGASTTFTRVNTPSGLPEEVTGGFTPREITQMKRRGILTVHTPGDGIRYTDGEDALGAMGSDAYQDMLRRKLGNSGAGDFRAALDFVRGSPDPSHQLLAAHYDAIINSGSAPRGTRTQLMPTADLDTGDTFRQRGIPSEIVEDEDGVRHVKDGDDLPTVPLDMLDHVPVDRGSLVKSETPRQPQWDGGDPFDFSDVHDAMREAGVEPARAKAVVADVARDTIHPEETHADLQGTTPQNHPAEPRAADQGGADSDRGGQGRADTRAAKSTGEATAVRPADSGEELMMRLTGPKRGRGQSYSNIQLRDALADEMRNRGYLVNTDDAKTTNSAYAMVRDDSGNFYKIRVGDHARAGARVRGVWDDNADIRPTSFDQTASQIDRLLDRLPNIKKPAAEASESRMPAAEPDAGLVAGSVSKRSSRLNESSVADTDTAGQEKSQFFNADAAGASKPGEGLYGQTVFDRATGEQGAMFDTSKPQQVSEPIKGSKSALDPKNTAVMDFSSERGPVADMTTRGMSAAGVNELTRDGNPVFTKPATTEKPTSTKNAVVEEERAGRGMAAAEKVARREFGTVWDQATQERQDRPEAIADLVNELKAKPRAVTDKENAMLLQRQIDLHNQHQRLQDAVVKDFENGKYDEPQAAQNRLKLSDVEDQLYDLYKVNKSVGTETARGLSARRMMANHDYTLAQMEVAKRAANGGRKLTDPERAEVRRQQKKIADSQDALDAHTDAILNARNADANAAERRKIQSLVAAAADTERRVKENELGTSQYASRPDSEMAARLRQRLEEARKKLADARAAQQTKPDPQAIQLKAAKSRLTSNIGDLANRITDQDFSKRATTPVVLDQEGLRLKAENERLKLEFQRDLMRDRLRSRPFSQRTMDWAVKFRRAMLLSSPATLLKLGSAAAERIAFTPAEEAIGKVIEQIAPRLSNAAPREGSASTKVELKAMAKGFTDGAKDAWKTLRTGQSDLDTLHGKPDIMPTSLLDLPGTIHAAIKAPAKRAEYERGLEKRMLDSVRNGEDVTDPTVIAKNAAGAFADSNRAVFLQDNRVADIVKGGSERAERKDPATGKTPLGGKIAATTLRLMVPITKVPLNIVSETVQHVTGLPVGVARVIGSALTKSDYTPAQADSIMRQLKKGSLGAGLLALGYLKADKIGGYYQPGKRDEKEVGFGKIRLFGHDLPAWLLHNPALAVLQFGATIRRVADARAGKSDAEPQGLTMGIAQATAGLVKETPMMREAQEATNLLDPREGGRTAGSIAKSFIVPAGVDWAARQFDQKDAQGNPAQRKPQGILQNIESGIPGLRPRVPLKTTPQQEREAEVWQGIRKPTRPPRPLSAIQSDLKRIGIQPAIDRYLAASPQDRVAMYPVVARMIAKSTALTPRGKQMFIARLGPRPTP